MTSRRVLIAVVVLLCTALTVNITGCSLIGLVVGTAADANRPPRQIPPGGFQGIAPGTQISFILKDGGSIRGHYVGVGRTPDLEYAQRYEQWRKGPWDEGRAPALGDSITLSRQDGAQLQGVLLGFGYGWVHVHLPGEERPRYVRFSEFTSIRDGSGREIAANELKRMESTGELPSLTAFGVKYGRDTTLVAMDRVAMVEVPPNGGSAAVAGLLVGLAIDVLVVTSIRQDAQKCGGQSSIYGMAPARQAEAFVPEPRFSTSASSRAGTRFLH